MICQCQPCCESTQLPARSWHRALAVIQFVMPSAPPTLSQTLKEARQLRRISQLELALRIGISQRHASFVECGRAQPSRKVLLAWLDELKVPLAIHNMALQQAGFAPGYSRCQLGDAELAPAREALAQLLAAHDPMPAMVLDARWNVMQTNQGARWLMSTLMPWATGLPAAPVA